MRIRLNVKATVFLSFPFVKRAKASLLASGEGYGFFLPRQIILVILRVRVSRDK